MKHPKKKGSAWRMAAISSWALLILLIVSLFVKVRLQRRQIGMLRSDVRSLEHAVRREVNRKPPDYVEVRRLLAKVDQNMYLISNPDGTFSAYPNVEAPKSDLSSMTSLEEMLRWQKKAREDLIRSLVGRIPPKLPLESEAKLIEKREKYDLYHVSFMTRYGQRRRAALSVPRNLQKNDKLPAVVAFAGTGLGGVGELQMFDKNTFENFNKDIFVGTYVYPMLFAERGEDERRYVVLAMDPICGEPREVLADRGNHKLGELGAQRFLDGLAALDYLETIQHVDRGRIACVGLSGGGWMSRLMAAVDERVKAVIVCGQNLGSRNEVEDIPALIAPRRAIYSNGFYDFDNSCLPFKVASQLPAVRNAYQIFGKPENVTYVIHPGAHLFEERYCVTFLDRYMEELASEDTRRDE